MDIEEKKRLLALQRHWLTHLEQTSSKIGVTYERDGCRYEWAEWRLKLMLTIAVAEDLVQGRSTQIQLIERLERQTEVPPQAFMVPCESR